MSPNRLFYLLMVAVLIVTGCVPRVATEMPQSQGVDIPITGHPQAGSTPGFCPCFEGLSSGLDNATQARIRTVSMVMGAPVTTVYVNGMPTLNGGVAQRNIAAGQFSGWLYVTPGTYTIALVTPGGTPEQALFPPTEIRVEAGHRYTVAAMGQLADLDVHPLIVDETTLEADLPSTASDNLTIDINNLKGAESITEKAYGKMTAENIPYGEARAWLCASGSPTFATLANNNGNSEMIFQGTFWAEPGTSFALPWYGTYPASNYDSVGYTSQGTSELSVIDFLTGFGGRDVIIDAHSATFDTFLKLIDKAGLREQLVSSGPYFIMVPTDDAFSALSQSQLDALLIDPEALMNLFDAHIVDGYYPYGSLSGPQYGFANRAVTNRLGQELRFIGDQLNGVPIGPNYTVGNGNRVQIIYDLVPSE